MESSAILLSFIYLKSFLCLNIVWADILEASIDIEKTFWSSYRNKAVFVFFVGGGGKFLD